MRRRWRFLLEVLAAAGLLATTTGCLPGMPCWDIAYSMDAATNEMIYLSRAVPIEEGVNDPGLTQEQRDKLAFVVKARDYAEHVIGLNVNSSYRSFVNLGGQPLAWNLSASRKDAIEAYNWQLPVVGRISYLGFFTYDVMIAERDWLRSIGYDTFIYEIDAFSTLGLLPDPVSSALLKRPYYGLAETVVHEVTHNTIWAPHDAVFSESLASFVGRTGGLEFVAAEYGSDSPLLTQADNEYHDEDIINEFLKQMVTDLNALYAQPISSEEKITRRDSIFQAQRERFVAEVQPTLREPNRYASYGTYPYNNAFLLVNVRYNGDPQVFVDVYERNNHSWSATLAVFAEAARASAPYDYLRNYLNTDASQTAP